MKYPITLKREIWNSFLHIIIGGVIAYVIVPTYHWYIIITLTFLVGCGREVLQHFRGKDQPFYIQAIDTMGFVFGGGLWIAIREIFNINADLL